MLPVTTWRCGIRSSDLSGWEKFESLDPAVYCPRGYAIASVDIRGSGHSSGSVQIMGEKMAQDGYDVIEALAKMSWCNGNVGMAGNSVRSGVLALAVAPVPPRLRSNPVLTPFFYSLCAVPRHFAVAHRCAAAAVAQGHRAVGGLRRPVPVRRSSSPSTLSPFLFHPAPPLSLLLSTHFCLTISRAVPSLAVSLSRLASSRPNTLPRYPPTVSSLRAVASSKCTSTSLSLSLGL